MAAWVVRGELDDLGGTGEGRVGRGCVSRFPVLDLVVGLSLFLFADDGRAGRQCLLWLGDRLQRPVVGHDQGRGLFRVAFTLAESVANLNAIADLFARKMSTAKVRLLWGTANLFSHRRYMAGAATNTDPAVFADAAGPVRAAPEETHALGGQHHERLLGAEG